MSESGRFDVRGFGAVGDGRHDDTSAVQAAIDAAGEVAGAVWFAPGRYAVSQLQMRSHVALCADATWSYHRVGSACLLAADGGVACVVDLSGTIGARISGMSLDGAKVGTALAAIHLDGAGHREEETLVIENTRIAHFSGDAITLTNVWGYTVRQSMMIFNGGNGLTITRWDGWIHDNIFNNNDGWGIACLRPNGAATVTGNRIEWNHTGGMLVEHGGNYNINSNFFDRSGGPALKIVGTPDAKPGIFTVTGNIFKRSGARVPLDELENCHVYLDQVDGLAMTANSLVIGGNDSGSGQISPAHGIVYRGLRDAVISNNTLHKGATRQLLVDRGDHGEGVCISANPGRLAE